MKVKDHKQLFRISSEVWNSLTIDDITKTYEDMRTLGIATPPMPCYAIEVNEKFTHQLHHLFFTHNTEGKKKEEIKTQYGLYIEYNFDNYPEVDEGSRLYIYRIMSDGTYLWKDDLALMVMQKIITEEMSERVEKTISSLASIINAMLLVLLATKNSVQEQRLDKQLASGKFSKANIHRKNYPLTTTIRIGKITETMRASDGQTYTVRPHLRRGHIRNQHYGPKNEMVKSVFIQPVFVNADEGWIAERRAYNVG